MVLSGTKAAMNPKIYINQAARVFAQRESLAIKAFPYFCCIFSIEILYFCAKIAFIYGSSSGIAAGIILVLSLCMLVIMSWFPVRWAIFVLLVLCEIHCAYSFVMVISSVWFGAISVPLWLFILRVCMMSVEILFPFILVPAFERNEV